MSRSLHNERIAPTSSRAWTLSAVEAPKRLLSLEVEQSLTARQAEILDTLEESILDERLAELTMAEIAARMNCSLRTLYGIAPSKEELVLAIVDRRLHRIGREAVRALELDTSPLEQLRAYLRATNLAVGPTTAAFTRDFGRMPSAQRVLADHAAYVVAVTHALLEQAVAAGEIDRVDTVALAHVLGGLGAELSRPSVEKRIEGTPKMAADAIADLLFKGLSKGSASTS